jgi:hypothetical protein
MRLQGVQQHVQRPDDPHIETVLMHAYFGARVQAIRTGVFPTVYAYDVRSCYPSALVTLPSSIGAWKHAKKYNPDAQWSVWRVRWEIGDDEVMIAPFPFRLEDRSIVWPSTGEGWYWNIELSAVIQDHPNIEIIEGWIFTPDDPDARPFAYIADDYKTRDEMKRAGDATEIVLKIAMASSYGKLAQGSRVDEKGGLKIPKFQQYMWAGLITAHARATLYRAAMLKPKSVIAFATDGIWTTQKIPLEISHDLGKWEMTKGSNFFIIKPGIYDVESVEGKPKAKRRGYTDLELTPSIVTEMREKWQQDGIHMQQEITLHRFIGLGIAASRAWWDRWPSFMTFTQTIKAMPDKQWAEQTQSNPRQYRLFPATAETFDASVSAPYAQQHLGDSQFSRDIEEARAFAYEQPDWIPDIDDLRWHDPEEKVYK